MMQKLSEAIREARDEFDGGGRGPSVEDMLDWMIEAEFMEKKLDVTFNHWSDCALNNLPAYPQQPCNCDRNAPLASHGG